MYDWIKNIIKKLLNIILQNLLINVTIETTGISMIENERKRNVSIYINIYTLKKESNINFPDLWKKNSPL